VKHARPDYARFQDPAGIIPEDEPVFILRGQDRLAWHIVKIYAWVAELAGADDDLVRRCREHADLMKAWPKKKTPDLPASYPNDTDIDAP
jgi:hypothetical protein